MSLSRLLLVVMLACLPATTAHAVVYCASTESELRAALAAIGSSFNSENVEIRLTRRVYFNGAQVFALQVPGPPGDLVLSGGWAAGASSACDIQAIDARLTVVDAQGASPVLSIQRNSISGSITPLIRVTNLTLRNGSAASAPVGLYIYNAFGSVEVDNVIVHGNRAVSSQFLGGVAMTLDSTTRDITLRNSLIYDNRGQFVTGFELTSVVFTSLSLSPNRNWYATNNTIVAGAGVATEGIRLQSDGNFWMTNNIVRGTVGYAGSITGAGAATAPQLRQLFNNFASTPSTSEAVVVTNIANTVVDPQLDPASNALLPTSPLINAGLGSPPGGVPAQDAWGQPRVFGTFVDVGALESQVLPDPLFGNGFE
jgi:hypothetical protein